MDEINIKTDELCSALRACREYTEFCDAREEAFKNETQRTLLNEYRSMQQKLQAAEFGGTVDEDELMRFQKLGELLQLDAASSRYLFAQYRLNMRLARIYRKLAEAVEADAGLISD